MDLLDLPRQGLLELLFAPNRELGCWPWVPKGPFAVPSRSTSPMHLSGHAFDVCLLLTYLDPIRSSMLTLLASLEAGLRVTRRFRNCVHARRRKNLPPAFMCSVTCVVNIAALNTVVIPPVGVIDFQLKIPQSSSPSNNFILSQSPAARSQTHTLLSLPIN